ncbi:ComF family protein [Fodinibius salinus]|uniref:ComF family protein n=1 Tax=Fodinibius salinus TaxID=860790 RepID=UPI001FE9EB0A|nr:phosphoribosyltransferase family protein [Fodinibius salinus]
MSQLAFPNVCVCCGRENTQAQRQICSFCLEDRFEDANPNNEQASSDTLLPEEVLFQHALWAFDKGGDLQHLLHQLKYDRLTTIGVDLGRKLGERVQNHPHINEALQQKNAVILPVPLHYLKFRYRGFNQAFEIAKGFGSVFSELNICNIKDVVRTKNTRTQTGFSLEKRLQNISDAFTVKNKSAFAGKIVVIVDDVFTTGATTFELAQTLLKSEAESIIILTIAQA